MSLRRYFKYSLVIHGSLLILLVIVTYALPHSRRDKMKFIILPKGTSLDAVLTPELAKETLAQATASQEPESAQQPGETDSRSVAAPEGTLAPSRPAPAAAPVPSSTASSPTPSPTVRSTPTPAKTVVVPPKLSPSPRPSPTPERAQPSRSENAHEATPARSKSKPSSSRPGPDKPGKTAVPASNASKTRNPDLPRRLPAGVTPRQATTGEEVGVPGVPEGIEGAPLPLDRTQSRLSMLYATRARMRIQSNFTVPPDVNDPNLTCVLEWEITSDGTIRNIRVVKSTGQARLDSCAIEALRKTENLGPLPPEWGKASVWTSLTFVFAGDRPVGSEESPGSPESANPRTTERH